MDGSAGNTAGTGGATGGSGGRGGAAGAQAGRGGGGSAGSVGGSGGGGVSGSGGGTAGSSAGVGGRGGVGGIAGGSGTGGTSGIGGASGRGGAAGSCGIVPGMGSAGPCGSMFNFDSGPQGAMINAGSTAFTSIASSGTFTFCGAGALALTALYSGTSGPTIKGEVLIILPGAPVDLTGQDDHGTRSCGSWMQLRPLPVARREHAGRPAVLQPFGSDPPSHQHLEDRDGDGYRGRWLDVCSRTEPAVYFGDQLSRNHLRRRDRHQVTAEGRPRPPRRSLRSRNRHGLRRTSSRSRSGTDSRLAPATR